MKNPAGRTRKKVVVTIKTARELVGSHTLGANAQFSDWCRVSEQARIFYVTSACQAAAKAKLGEFDPKVILERMKKLYADRENQDIKVSLAFGMALTMKRDGRAEGNDGK